MERAAWLHGVRVTECCDALGCRPGDNGLRDVRCKLTVQPPFAQRDQVALVRFRPSAQTHAGENLRFWAVNFRGTWMIL